MISSAGEGRKYQTSAVRIRSERNAFGETERTQQNKAKIGRESCPAANLQSASPVRAPRDRMGELMP